MATPLSGRRPRIPGNKLDDDQRLALGRGSIFRYQIPGDPRNITAGLYQYHSKRFLAYMEQGRFDKAAIEAHAIFELCPDSHELPHHRKGNITSHGYLEVLVPGHPYVKSGYVRYHRWVVELHLGRYLEPHEHVHHIDCDKRNNDISNLQVVSHEEHMAIHAELRRQSKSNAA